MDIEECKLMFENIGAEISGRRKSYIHYNSFSNFFKNFDFLKSTENKNIVLQLLEEYVLFVSENIEGIDRTMGMDLTSRYLMPIGKIYKEQLDFKEVLKQKNLILFSSIIDIVLILFGIEKLFGIPLPLITIATVFYYTFFLNPVIKQGKVFGIFW